MLKSVQEIADPPGDWVLADEPGECIVSLTKKYKDESILVEMNINDQVRSSADWIVLCSERKDGDLTADSQVLPGACPCDCIQSHHNMR